VQNGSNDRITRVFPEGATFNFACDIFDSSVAKRSAHPKIDFEVDLFRGPERIYKGAVLPMYDQDPEKPMVLAGAVRLPPDLPPGDYAMELLVYDRIGGHKTPPVGQWMDFSIVRHPGST